MTINVHELAEKTIRQQVRSMLNEAAVLVPLEQGSNFHRDIKAASGDEKLMLSLLKTMIKSLNAGDRADQKFSGKLKAFRHSLKSKNHPDWRIIELAFAEWARQRKANPVQSDVSVVHSVQSESKQITNDVMKKVADLVNGGTPEDRIVSSVLGKKYGLTLGDVHTFVDRAAKGLLERKLNESKYDLSNEIKSQIQKKYGKVKEVHYEDSKCEDGNGNLESNPYYTVITSKGRVTVILSRDFSKVSEMHLNESHKKTELETIYENLESFARRNNTKVFDVLDEMLSYTERQVSVEPTSKQETNTGFHPPGEWGFDHEGSHVTNPLVDLNGNDCDPVEFYGDSFLNSRFPFVHGDVMIVDPRYNETGELEVEPSSYYGNAYKESDYLRAFNESPKEE